MRVKFNYRGMTELLPTAEPWINHLGEQCYYWEWKEGGYNSLWARDLDHLKDKISKQFSGSKLDVAWSTVRPVSQQESERIDRAAYLAWC